MAPHRFGVVLSALIVALPLVAHAAPAGTVVVAQGVDPTTLDPQNHQESPAANLVTNIFDSLLERDHNLKLVPLLAESYRIAAPTAWEFKLRRLELYQRINRLWVDTAAAMPLYQQLDVYGATKRIEWKARGDERIKGYDLAVRDGT